MDLDSTEELLKQIETLKKENKRLKGKNKTPVLEDKNFLYDVVVEDGPLGIALTTPGLKFLKVNSTLCRLLGYTAEELLLMSVKDISHPEDYRKDFDKFQLLREGKINSYSMEIRLIKSDKSVLFCKLTGNMSYDSKGNPKYGIGYIEEITLEKKLNKKFFETEERYRTIYNMSGEFIYIYDLRGFFIEVNEATEKRLGYTKEELKNINIRDLILKKDIKKLEQRLSAVIKGEKLSFVASYRLKNKYGEFIDIESSISLIHREGKPFAYLGIARDVTERNEIYAELKESKELYQLLVENQTDLIVKVTTDKKYLYVNPSYCELFGKTEDELLGKTFVPFLHEEDLQKNEELFKSAFNPPYVNYIEERELTILGWRWIAWSIKALHDKKGKITSILGLGRDIHDKKLAEIELQKSKERFRDTIDFLPVSVYEFDNERNIILLNRKAKEFTGITDEEIAEGKLNPFDYVIPSNTEKAVKNLERVIKNGESLYNLEYKIRHKNGRITSVIANNTPIYENDKIVGIRGSATDISQLKSIEEELRKSEKKYKEFFDDDLSAIVLSNLKGEILDCNPAFISIFKYSYNEIKNIIVDDLYVEKNDRIILLENLKKHGFVKSYPVILKDKSGKNLNIIGNFQAIYDSENNFILIRSYLLDYTEQEVMRRALIESEARFKELVDLLPVAVYESDLDGNLTFVNRSGLKQIGADEKTLAQEIKMLDFVADESKKEIFSDLNNFLNVDEPENFSRKYIIQRKDGTKFPVMIYSSLIIKKGKPAGIRGIGIDISDEEKLVKALQESEEKYRTLFEKDFSAVLVTDLSGKILDCNPAFVKMAGLKSIEETKKLNTDFLYQDQNDRIKIKELLQKNGEIKNYEFRMKNIAGETIYITGNAAADYNEKGEITTIRKYLQNNTETKLAQQKLEEYKNHLETIVRERTEQLSVELEKQKEAEEKIHLALQKEKELNELKTGFISTASHEFRTPLTSIRLYTDLISISAPGGISEELKRYIGHIQAAVKNMTTLINDVLTISRTETGKILFAPSEINLRRFSERLLEDLKGVCTSKHILNLAYKPEKETFILDEKLLRHILENLLSNGIKYSPDGGLVSLEVNIENQQILFGIYDEGMGIPQNELKNIFEPFYRTSVSISTEGTGLGLTIVKHSVELHGGTIEVKSELNKGTQFFVRLPIVNGK